MTGSTSPPALTDKTSSKKSKINPQDLKIVSELKSIFAKAEKVSKGGHGSPAKKVVLSFKWKSSKGMQGKAEAQVSIRNQGDGVTTVNFAEKGDRADQDDVQLLLSST